MASIQTAHIVLEPHPQKSCDMEHKELGNSGVKIPVLGLGTWGIGGFSSRHLGGDDEAVPLCGSALSLG